MPSRSDVVAKARELVGRTAGGRPSVRFRHQGRNPQAGMDCGGVLLWVGKELDLVDFDFTAYQRYPDGKTLRRLFDELFERVSGDLRGAKAGDLVLFRKVEHGWPCHMGILTGQPGQFGIVHSWETAGGVTENGLAEDMTKKLVGVWSYPGLED